MTFANQLQNKLKFVPSFIGVYACDRIPELTSLPVSMIINTDKHNEKGEHWVAIYISEKKKGYYFDSYGMPPINGEIENFLNKHTMLWKYNHRTIQGINSIKCGQFSVLFVILKTLGFSFNKITHLFTNNYIINDFIVQKIFDLF